MKYSDRDNNSRRSTMYQAVCSVCGKACEVPFKPRGDKPVFCSSCFQARREKKPTMYQAICDKCGKACEVPFKPRGDKPIYCKECFEESKISGRGVSGEQLQKQFDSLHAKLDSILVALETVTAKKKAKKIVKKTLVKKATTKKVAAKKTTTKAKKK